MNKGLTNVFGLVSVSFLPYLVNFLVLPLYSQTLSSKDFGIIGLITACMMIASTWSNLQLPGALSRIYYDYKGEEREKCVSSIINSSFLISILFTSSYILMREQLSIMVLGDDSYQDEIYIASLLLLFNLTNISLERLLINQKKGGVIFLRSIISQIISVSVGLWLVVYEQLGILGFLLSQLSYALGMTIFSVYIVRKQYKFVICVKYITNSLKYSLPLVIHALGGVIFMYSSVFFIERYLSLAALGVFFIADKFSQVVKVFVNSLNNVIMPHYNQISVNNEDEGRRFLESLIPVWLIIGLPSIVSYVYVANSFIETYIEGDYSEVFSVLFMMCFAYIFRGLYCFASAPLFYYKKTKLIPKITIYTGCLSLLLNYLLINNLDLFGAGLSIFLSFVITFLLAWYYSKLAYRLKFNVGFILASALSIIVVAQHVLFNSADFIVMLIISSLNLTLMLAITFYFNILGAKEKIYRLKEYL